MIDDHDIHPADTQIPRAAALLGASGVLPPLAGVIAAALGLTHQAGSELAAILAAYGATILAFIGGTHWGFAAREPSENLARGLVLGLSVLPSLSAWLFILGDARIGLFLLGAGFFAVLFLDRFTSIAGMAPAWWMRLRGLLSPVMGTLHILLAVSL